VTSDAPLGALLPTLVDEPGLVAVMGKRNAIVAVPEAARPLSLAAIASQTERAPLVVAVPTSMEAERLRSDLALYLGDDEVALFPAWETSTSSNRSSSVSATKSILQICRYNWSIRGIAGSLR